MHAGKLEIFTHKWRKITSDKVILSYIEGFKLTCIKELIQNIVPEETTWSVSEQNIIHSSIEDLLKIGAISIVESCKNQYISKIFSVSK